MEDKTSIASGIDITQLKADYDAACKRLLSEKIILAWILKNCVLEFRDADVNEIAEKYIEGEPYISEVPVAPDETGPVLRGLNTAQTSPTEGSVYFDIYFRAIVPGTEKTIELLINVEAQGDFYPGYPLPKRGIFYCGRMISSQAGTVFEKSEYGKLRKVYSIFICLNPPKFREYTITRYRMFEENIVGEDHEPAENYDLISLVMIHLSAKDAKAGEGEHDNAKSGGGLLRLLDTLLSSETAAAEKKQILEKEYGIPMTRSMDREVSHLCNLSQYVEERGVQKGIQLGKQEGKREGIVTSIKSLMETTGWTFEKAVSALCVPSSQWEMYRSELGKKLEAQQ